MSKSCTRPLREASQKPSRRLPRIETEADLLEGLAIPGPAASRAAAPGLRHERDHRSCSPERGPFSEDGPGPNPDPLLRRRANPRRSTRTARHHHRPELSAARQQYTDISIMIASRPTTVTRYHAAPDGTGFEWRFDQRPGQLIDPGRVRRDGTQQRGTLWPSGWAPSAPTPPPLTRAHGKSVMPQRDPSLWWVALISPSGSQPVNMVAPRFRWPGRSYSSAGHFEARPGQAGDHGAGDGAT